MEEHNEVLERIQRKHSSWGDKNFADYSAMETLGDVARLLEGRKIPDVEAFEVLIRSLQECDQYKHSFADALGQSNSSFEVNSKKKRKTNDKKGNSSDDEAPKIGGMSVQRKKEKSSNKFPFVQPGTILANFGVPESSVSKPQQASEQTPGNPSEKVDNTTHVFTNDTKVNEEPLAMDISINKDSEKLFIFFDQVRKRYGDESRIIVQIFMDIVGKYVARKIDYLACASMLQYLFRENPQLVAQSLNISEIDYFVDSNGSILTLSSKDGQHISSYMQKSAVGAHNSQLANCRKRIVNRVSSDPNYREIFLSAQATHAATNATAQSNYSYSSGSQSGSLLTKPITYAPYIPPRTGPPVIPKIIPPNTGNSSSSYANIGMNNQFNKHLHQPAAAAVIPKPVVPEPVVPEDFREYLAAVKEAVSKEIYHKFLDSMIGIRNNFKDSSTTSRLQYESIRVARGMIPEKVKHLRSYLDRFLIEE